MAANQFIPILSLPVLPGPPSIGQKFVIQGGGVTYQVDARQLPLNGDMFITWGSQSVDLPGSRTLTAGFGISIVNGGGPGGPLTIAWTGAGVIPDGNKGDITTSGLGTVWTINAQAVTYAKMQNVSATSRVLGRFTAGAGSVEELTPTQLTTFVNLFTTALSGAVPAPGSATGKILSDNGTWIAPSAGNLTATYLTVANETGSLVNSRRMLAGTNITFDDTTAGVRTINGAAGGVTSITAGTGIKVDSSIPSAPVVSDDLVATTDAAVTGAKTLNLALGPCFNLTLTGAATFTITNPYASGKMQTVTLIIRQDGTGSRTVTWPANVKWSLGTAPVLSTAPNAIDVITLFTIDGGTTYFGGQSMAAVA